MSQLLRLIIEVERVGDANHAAVTCASAVTSALATLLANDKFREGNLPRSSEHIICVTGAYESSSTVKATVEWGIDEYPEMSGAIMHLAQDNKFDQLSPEEKTKA